MNSNYIKVEVVSNNGIPDKDLTLEAFMKAFDKFFAENSSTQETIESSIFGYLRSIPKLSTVTTDTLVERAYEAAVEQLTALGENTATTRDEARARMKRRVPEFIKAHPELFAARQKAGIAVRMVPGEHDDEGRQVYRTSDEDWAKITAPKPEKTKAAKAA